MKIKLRKWYRENEPYFMHSEPHSDFICYVENDKGTFTQWGDSLPSDTTIKENRIYLQNLSGLKLCKRPLKIV